MAGSNLLQLPPQGCWHLVFGDVLVAVRCDSWHELGALAKALTAQVSEFVFKQFANRLVVPSPSRDLNEPVLGSLP